MIAVFKNENDLELAAQHRNFKKPTRSNTTPKTKTTTTTTKQKQQCSYCSPEMAFSLRLRTRRAVRFPISGGITPEGLLPFRDRHEIRWQKGCYMNGAHIFRHTPPQHLTHGRADFEASRKGDHGADSLLFTKRTQRGNGRK